MAIKKACNAMNSVKDGVVGDYAAELIFFLFKISEAMLEPSVRLYLYEAVCLEHVDSYHKCAKLNHYPVEESDVQHIAASYLMYYKILLNVPAVVLVLFCGAWSDRYGRKLPVMLTCFGAIVSVLLYMMSKQIKINKGPYLPLILIGAAVRGACGRSAVMTMSCHSYVTDVSTMETRTRKLANLQAMSHFGYLAGCIIAGYLLDVANFMVVFCVVVIIQSTCFLTASLCMRDTLAPDVQDQMQDESGEVNQSACNFFKLKGLTACVDVIIRPRRRHAQCYLIILLIAIMIQQTCKSGELDMLLLFTLRAPFSWMRSTYSYMIGADFACLGFMAFFVLPCLVRCCGCTDIALILSGLIFKIGRTLMLAFSDQTWMIFTAIAIGAPFSFTITGFKSLISKLIDEDEIGKTFSIISSFETLSNLMGTIIFNNVYAATFPTWPGFGFALEAGLYFLILCMVASMVCGLREATYEPLIKNVDNKDKYPSYGAIAEDSETQVIIQGPNTTTKDSN